MKKLILSLIISYFFMNYAYAQELQENVQQELQNYWSFICPDKYLYAKPLKRKGFKYFMGSNDILFENTYYWIENNNYWYDRRINFNKLILLSCGTIENKSCVLELLKLEELKNQTKAIKDNRPIVNVHNSNYNNNYTAPSYIKY